MTSAPLGIHPTDRMVGARIRTARTLKGISQSTLAQGLSLTFQQVQKYEKGTNRVSASKLLDVAKLLDQPVSWFFDQADYATAAAPRNPLEGQILAAVRQLPYTSQMVLRDVAVALAGRNGAKP